MKEMSYAYAILVATISLMVIAALWKAKKNEIKADVKNVLSRFRRPR